MFKRNIKYKEYNEGKYILRKAMNEIVPDEILKRRKQGFSSPDASWYRDENSKYIKDILLNKNAAYRDIINQKYVENILDEHINNKINHRLLIWSLLSFEWWIRIFFKE